MAENDDRPTYWAIPASLVEELREAGMVCEETNPAELGKAIFQFLREAEYPNDLAERLLDCLDGGTQTIH